MLSVRCSSKFPDEGLLWILVRDTLVVLDRGRLEVISEVFTKLVEVELAARVVAQGNAEVVVFLNVLNLLVSKIHYKIH